MKLSGNQLKLIAIVAMTIDHLAWLLWPGLNEAPVAIVAHIIGRLTLPIMIFFVSEGLKYTTSKYAYFLRLMGFAMISHYPYLFAFGYPLKNTGVLITSIMFTLSMSVLLAILYDFSDGIKLYNIILILFMVAIVMLSLFADGSWLAVLTPFLMYRSTLRITQVNNADKRLGILSVLIFSFGVFNVLLAPHNVYSYITFGQLLSITILKKYSGERGKESKLIQYGFYWFYPVHLLIIGIARMLLYGNVSII